MKRVMQIFAIARNDLTLILRDRQSLLWLFVMPLIFTYAFGGMNRGSGTGTAGQAPIPVAVNDSLFLGKALVQAMEDRTWKPEVHSEEDSLLMRRGSWVVLPEGLTQKILSGGRDTIEVVSKRGGSTRRAESFAWSARKAAIQVLLNLNQIPDSLLASGENETLIAAYDSIASAPALIDLEVLNASRSEPIPRGYLFTVPGNMIMFILIVALTSGAADIAVEVRQGHLKRLATGPLSKMDIFAGKIVGRLMTSAVQIIFLMVVSTLIFDMRWGNDPLALALLLLIYSTTAATIGVFLGLRIGRPEAAAGTGVLVTLVMSALGGCWWPLEIVPETMKRVAHLFPTGWALESLHRLISHGGTLGDIVPNLLVLLGYIALFALLGSRTLRFDRN